MKHHAFLACHPAVNLLYFVLVLTFSMFFLHPLCLAVSLCAALWCAAQLNGGRAVRRTALWLAPTALLAALVNLAFNHQGATILAYLPSGNPLTLESIAYGFAAAAMLAAVVLWFSCWNTVMTSDKLMHLFGRVVPALSLLLSMTLRFVPRFQAKLREVTAARRGMGLYAEKGRLQKLKSAVTVFSVMVTWSLENAVETADSMKSRGYGLPGRTGYSASKYAMTGFLETLRIENLKKGLHVMIACPGFTASNVRFSALTADGTQQGATPRDEAKMMTPEEVARIVARGIQKRKRLCLMENEGRATHFVKKFAPGFLDRMFYLVMSREPDSPLK